MFSLLSQVMLYVNDQQQARQFWVEKLGFVVVAEETDGPVQWIEVAPKNAQTSIVLHDKQAIAKMSPELDLATPSLMFATENIQALYDELVAKGVTVGEMVQMPSGQLFNFADEEGHYFAVKQV